MHRLRFLPVLILVIVPSLLWSQESYVAPKRLWSWFGDCGQKKYVGLEVALSRKVIYRSSFPVCPIEDYSENVKDLLSARGSPGRKLVFSFKGGHVFQGEYRTTPTQTIEANVWQSGTGPGVILLGLSFSTKKQLLLNTIHVAQMDKAFTSEIDHGLTVRTFPISHKSARISCIFDDWRKIPITLIMCCSLCEHLGSEEVPCLPHRLLDCLNVVLGCGLGLLVPEDGLHVLE